MIAIAAMRNQIGRGPAGSNVLNETGTNKPDSKNGTMWYWNEATTMSITSRVQNTGRNGRVQYAVPGVLFVAALAVTGCATPQAEVNRSPGSGSAGHCHEWRTAEGFARSLYE